MSRVSSIPPLSQLPNSATRYPVNEDDLKPLFYRILDIVKSRKFFDESPTFFVVYAWDNGSEEAKAEIVVEFIEACQRAGCRITSDQGPAARVVTEEQLCLLPFTLHKESVELVVLCGSDLLGRYMKDEKVKQFVKKMAERYAEAQGVAAKRKAVLEVYEEYSGDHGFHHVYTEMALLNIRNECSERNSIIPFLLNGNHEDNFPTYLTQHKDILRTALGLKPERDGSKYECFLQILEKFADHRTHGPGSANLIQSLRKVYGRAIAGLESHRSLAKADLESILNRHKDEANYVSDEWSNSQRLPPTTEVNNHRTQGRLTRKIKIFNTLRSAYRDGKDRNPRRVPGTCEWFVTHKSFRQWQESGLSSMLWVSADPGCGKSVLAKHLVDDVLPSTDTRTICYFFFKEDFEDQRSAVSALCCLLHQLFEQKEFLLSDKIMEKFETSGERLTTSVSELWNVLISASRDKFAGEILCILDAYDECVDQGQSELTQALCNFFSGDNNNKLKFLITSRPFGSIRRGFQPLDNIPGLPFIHLIGESDEEMKKVASEIDVFIEARVRSIQAILKLKPEEAQLLRRELLKIPNRTYVWVHLTLDLVQKAINIDARGISEAVSHLPRTVNEAYDEILAKSCDFEEAKKLLHIVVVATRPLTLTEMALALALREDTHCYKDIDLKSEDRFAEYVRDLCGLFVTIQGQKIYFLHQTAKEFLVWKDYPNVENGPISGLKWKSLLIPQESHRVLAQICLWHLLFDDFEIEPLQTSNLTQYLFNHVFLDYSAKNWAAHFRVSDIGDGEIVKSLLRLCDASSSRCQTWFNIYWESTHGSLPLGFTTMMIASYFGLERVVHVLLNENGALNSIDRTHRRSALSWASENGFDHVVGLLIKGPGNRLRDIVRLRFWRGAEVNARDKYGRTPLSYAAWNGHMAVVQQLVEAGAKTDLIDEIGGTPMSYALLSGQTAIVELLLKKRPKTGLDDTISGDLLLSAAQKGDKDVVKLLLDSGKVNTNLKNKSGRTPLSLAVENSHDAVVKLLLDCSDVDANLKDAAGRTPLSWATRSVVAHMLLNHSKINANLKDNPGRTPLSWAAQRGNRAVVTALLESSQVDTNSRDNSGRTPLSWAAESDERTIVELLLNHSKNKPDSKDNSGRTPLSWAAQRGSHAVVAALLQSSKVDADSRDDSGRTPLSWATENGMGKLIAQLLLERSEVNADSKDKSGRTPLSWAAQRGSRAGVTALLENSKVDADSKDDFGRTPLSWTTENDMGGLIARLLLERSEVNADSKDRSGRTPLSWAAEKGTIDTVRILLISGRVDADSKDKSGRTPLSWAAESGEGIAFQLLLQSGRVDANSKDGSGRTPLSWAVMAGQWHVVELLLDIMATDIGLKGSTDGWVVVENKIGQKINIAEPGTNIVMTMEQEAIQAVHKSTWGNQLRLCYPGNWNQWTSPFTINTGLTHVKIAKFRHRQHLIRADVSLMDGITFVQLSIESESWPLSIRNESEVDFVFWQMTLNVDDDNMSPSERRSIRYRLPGRSIMPYAWDYPTAKIKELVISTHGIERLVKFDKIGSATPLIFTAPSGEKNVIDIGIVADGPRRTLTLSLFAPKGSIARSKT